VKISQRIVQNTLRGLTPVVGYSLLEVFNIPEE
jgi:hypothetical protein